MSNNLSAVLSHQVQRPVQFKPPVSRSGVGNAASVHPASGTASNFPATNIILPKLVAPSVAQMLEYRHESQATERFTLFQGRNVKITREAAWELVPELKVVTKDGKQTEEVTGYKVVVLRDRLAIETGNSADTVYVSPAKSGGADININGKTFYINNKEQDPKVRELAIKTHGGGDHVRIAPEFKERVRVEAGSGNDYVEAGGGETRISGGAGNDHIRLGSGAGYAQGDEGDDIMIDGSGPGVLYGNDGNDRMFSGYFASNSRTFMDGGRGNDKMYTKSGESIMHGGLGNDLMVGCGRSHIYTGAGADLVVTAGKDTIFSQGKNNITPRTTSKIINVPDRLVSAEGFVVKGSAEFRRRVADDLDFLNASPTGQKMLTEMDSAGSRDGPVEISKLDEDNGYFLADEEGDVGAIQYNPSFSPQGKNRILPVVVLFHEMAHAYNNATSTELDGYTRVGDGARGLEPNAERQAVGLWTNAAPIDFDGDPATPVASTNPTQFSENGLRAEMGEPLRTAYNSANVV